MFSIKICGLTTFDDALAALEAGADYLGFVTYSKSPRGIDATVLRAICEKLPAGARTVGVFVNASRAIVETVACDCGLTVVQLHGDELSGAFQGLAWPLWRAVRLSDGLCRPSPDDWPAERYVVDAAPAGVYGGAGQTADWIAAADFARRHAMLLAGGLTPENVAEAVCAVRPAGVDVASGVEASSGRKDRACVRLFIERARAAARKAGLE